MSNKSNDYVLVISKDTLGNGSEDLGKILLKSYINTYTEVEKNPTHIIFLNKGVLLTTTNSNVVDDLKRLENLGVQLLACGTCLNYFKLEDKLAVGEKSNMRDIVHILSTTDKVIDI